MYDEDKHDNTIESINETIQNNEIDSIKQENETLRKMVETRNQELQKPKDNSEDKIIALSKVLGIDKMKMQIDELNQGQNALIGKLSEVIQGMINISNAINGNRQITNESAPAIGDPMQKMEILSNIIDKGVQLYSTFKQNQTPQTSTALIDQDFINKRMVESFMEDLDTGKSISTFIKNSLKKTASKNIVNTALKDIGNDSDEPV